MIAWLPCPGGRGQVGTALSLQWTWQLIWQSVRVYVCVCVCGVRVCVCGGVVGTHFYRRDPVWRDRTWRWYTCHTLWGHRTCAQSVHVRYHHFGRRSTEDGCGQACFIPLYDDLTFLVAAGGGGAGLWSGGRWAGDWKKWLVLSERWLPAEGGNDRNM